MERADCTTDSHQGCSGVEEKLRQCEYNLNVMTDLYNQPVLEELE